MVWGYRYVTENVSALLCHVTWHVTRDVLMYNSLIQFTLVTVPWGPGHCHPVTLPDSVMWTNIF